MLMLSAVSPAQTIPVIFFNEDQPNHRVDDDDISNTGALHEDVGNKHIGPMMRWHAARKTLVRVEAIISQLVFEHALRIRFKAETSADGSPRADQILIGKLNNLVTSGLRNITEAKDFMLLLVHMPLQLALCVWFLYVVLGWSAFVGLAAIITMLPIPGYVGQWVQTVQRELSKKTDARMQAVSEAMNLLRMIKIFAWQRKTGEEVDAKRELELSVLWKRRLIDMVHSVMNLVIPVVVMIAIFATYVGIRSARSRFSSLRSLQVVFLSITQLMTGKVSLDRVNDFLRNTELLDVYFDPKSDLASCQNCPDPDAMFMVCYFFGR
ncbi:ABC transporter transmembrane region-domain-containing protein [Mycena crocata]|nr:ABC transporter transmembrane region-domain-containing protein [Mycena crocata]